MIHPRGNRSTNSGYTIVEMMVVLTMMGVLLSIAAPSFHQALEQSRFDLAAANLRSVWSAERLYWLENRAYAGDLNTLMTAGLIDPAMLANTQFYSWAISSPDGTTFTASATRINSTSWTGTLTIDQTGTLTGSLQAPGRNTIYPVYQ
jgi:prepilin-type N-terminal cleavage/methylation domain-containing protein